MRPTKKVALAILAHGRTVRTYYLLETLRKYTVRDDFDVLVSEDVSTDEQHEMFAQAARQFNARHLRLPSRGGPQGNANFAMENTDADFVILCSDDVLWTKHAMDHLIAFYEDNDGLLGRVAGQHVHVWHADNMLKPGNKDAQAPAMGILGGKGEFYPPKFLYSRDGALPYKEHRECLSPCIVRGWHGSIGVVSRKHWDVTHGVSMNTWCFDHSNSYRIFDQTDAFFITFPMPILAHFGGASAFYGEPFPVQSTHDHQLAILCEEHGEKWTSDGNASRRIEARHIEKCKQYEIEMSEWLSRLQVRYKPPEERA